MNIAEALLVREILDGAEVARIIKGLPLEPLPNRRSDRHGGQHAAGFASRRPAPFARTFRRGASAAGVIPQFPVYLFDLDGTLVDSAEDICGAIQDSLTPTGCAPVTFEFLKSYIGRHLLDLYGDIFPHYTPAQLDELVERYRAIYRARGHKLTRIYRRRGRASPLSAGEIRPRQPRARRARAWSWNNSRDPHFSTCKAPTDFPANPSRILFCAH